jgi:hypothetical protein
MADAAKRAKKGTELRRPEEGETEVDHFVVTVDVRTAQLWSAYCGAARRTPISRIIATSANAAHEPKATPCRHQQLSFNVIQRE